MAAKKRKPGFDVPSGTSDAEWVYRSDTASGDAAPEPLAATPLVETPPEPPAHHAPERTYASLPGAAPTEGLKGTGMEGNNAPSAQAPGAMLVNGAKVLGEVAIVPGASLMVDGDMRSGIVRAAGGVLSMALLGPVFGKLAWLALGADSYSRSVSGKTIVDQFKR